MSPPPQNNVFTFDAIEKFENIPEDVLRQIQANILKDHCRKHIRCIFFKFPKKEINTPENIKKWVHLFWKDPLIEKHPIQSAYDQAEDSKIYVANGRKPTNKTVFCFFISAAGFRRIFPEIRNPYPSRREYLFIEGMGTKSDNRLCNDFPKNWWQKEFRHNHEFMILLANDDELVVERHAKLIKAELLDEAQGVFTQDRFIHIEKGFRKFENDDPNNPTIEHFGFHDGITKPQKPWKLAIVDDPNINQGFRFGSYLVFRKIEQNVYQFKENSKAIAGYSPMGRTQDQRTAEFSKTKEYKEAMAMGRFKNAKPLRFTDHKQKTPFADSEAREKGFNTFSEDYKGDSDGGKCPHFAHIRKVNPRIEIQNHPFSKDGKPIHSNDIQIVRRGLLYDDRVVKKDDKPKKGVGLLFMAYQKSIRDQFEYIHLQWRNNPNFPKGNEPFEPRTGVDPILYRKNVESESIKNSWNERWEKLASPTTFEGALKNITEFKGGEYFFAPPTTFFEIISKE